MKLTIFRDEPAMGFFIGVNASAPLFTSKNATAEHKTFILMLMEDYAANQLGDCSHAQQQQQQHKNGNEMMMGVTR